MDTKHFLPLGELGSERLLRSYSGGGGEEEEGEGIQKIEKSANSLRSCRLNPPPPRRRDALRPFSGKAGGCSPHPLPSIRLPTWCFSALSGWIYIIVIIIIIVLRGGASGIFKRGSPWLPGLGAAGGGGMGGGEGWQRAVSAVAFLSPFLSLLYSPPLFSSSL